MFGGYTRYPHRYIGLREVVSLPMIDGLRIPDTTLDMAWSLYTACRGRPMLVHCQAGYSRSVSVAYALLRRQYALDHETALARVKPFESTKEVPQHLTLTSAKDWVERKRSTPLS
jgi:protein-tyrosine phosphatase